MGCMSKRRTFEVRPEAKWDYISLKDFKSSSCFTPFAYCYLWFSLLLSTAVYSVDTFTAVNLLIFNRWSSEIDPTQLLSFDISKWIFSVCIILSFINLAFEHIRAQRIMRRGSVAESYLDNLAVRLESVRMGKGQGWRRFLVFAELTKSKKGAEYVALFTYFSFQSWIRVLLCSGPRQAVNALTLLSVYNAKLSINGEDFENSLLSFFQKIKALALDDTQQALILSGMIFTLVVWVFSFLSLLLAAIFFVTFLWHYIPRADGGLSGYCERKINKRLMKIVSVKINKAMAEDERRRKKAELKAAKKAGGDRPLSMQATLPNVGEDKLPEMPMLSRNDTMTTLPAYTSRPGTPGSFELNSLDQKRPLPSRTATTASSTSQFSSNAPLLGSAANMGMIRSESPVPSLPGTAASNRSFGGPPLSRMPTNGSGFGPAYTNSPAMYPSETMPALPPPIRSPVNGAPNGYRGPGPMRSPGTPGSRPGYDDYSNGRASPAPSGNSYRGGPLSPAGPNGYPLRSATNPMPPRGPQPYAPTRNMTAPIGPMHSQHQPTGSSGSMRGVVPPMPSSMSQHQPTGSSSSSRHGMGSGQPYSRAQESEEYDYFNRPTTANSQRTTPRGGYGNGRNQDIERGARY